MEQHLQKKNGLVENVFNRVFDKYDLMNDLMSLGAHRIWKKDLMMMMSPSKNKKLIDVGCGTGDIGKLYLETLNYQGQVFNVDPNKKMLEQGKKRLKNFNNISWQVNSAENLEFKPNYFDYYTISFGLRNAKDLNKSLKEAYRVLKPGGRFLCLEFSKISNSNLNFLYKNYSKLIPHIGKLIVGESKPYQYLVESIDKFINQDQLIELMEKNGFENCKYRDLSGGIVSIHSGWKI